MESVLQAIGDLVGQLGIEPLYMLGIAIVVAVGFVNWLLFGGIDAGTKRSSRFEMSCRFGDDDEDDGD